MSDRDSISEFGFKEKNRISQESVNFGVSLVETVAYGMYKLSAIR
jgi:hypothetical protein